MKVTIKEFNVGMEVKTKGIELAIYNPQGTRHLGDIVVTKSGLTWCEGRTRPENGTKLSWEKFQAYMNSL